MIKIALLTIPNFSKDDVIKSIQSNRALLIDFDNTLMDYPLNEKLALQKLFSEINLPEELHSQALSDYTRFNDYYWDQFDLKKIPIDKARHGGFEDLIKKYNLPYDDPKQLNDHFLECLVKTTKVKPEIIQALKELKEKLGTKLIIITNGVHWTQTARLENSGISKIIDAFFTSESVGFAKPHPKMFLDSKEYLQSINCPTKDLWVIGDSFESDIMGGFNVGFNTCWVRKDKIIDPIDRSSDGIPTITVNNFLEFAELYKKIKNAS